MSRVYSWKNERGNSANKYAKAEKKFKSISLLNLYSNQTIEKQSQLNH